MNRDDLKQRIKDDARQIKNDIQSKLDQIDSINAQKTKQLSQNSR